MDTPADRLKLAREKAGFSSASEAAEALGMKIPTYVQHENGNRGFKKDAAAVYARRFRTTPEYLLYGRGKAPEGPAIPSEEDLASMLESAQREIRADASYGDWPRLVAGALRTRLELFLAGGETDRDRVIETFPGKAARSPAPTKQAFRG